MMEESIEFLKRCKEIPALKTCKDNTYRTSQHGQSQLWSNEHKRSKQKSQSRVGDDDNSIDEMYKCNRYLINYFKDNTSD